MLLALRVVVLALFIAAPVGGRSPEAELQRLAEDYAADPTLTKPVTFGVRLGDAAWTVAARPATPDEPARVTVTRGAPEVPAFVYVTDAGTFARIAAGELHPYTAMAQQVHVHASDPMPMAVETVNGFSMNATARAVVLSVGFHFFTAARIGRPYS